MPPEGSDIITCALDYPETYPPKNDSWLEDDLHWMRAESVDARPGYREYRSEQVGG